MTEKQTQRIRDKISKIKKGLVADKKYWGGYYHDGRGLRYLPPELFIKIRDYKGALRYFRWFAKTFSDDSGYPIFLFEWTIVLFKTGKIIEAEKKAYETFFSNTYLFDKFLDKEFLRFNKWEGSSWEKDLLTDNLIYKKDEPEFIDFVAWLEIILKKDKFYKLANEFFDIEIKLKDESDGKIRSQLVNRRYKLLDDI